MQGSKKENNGGRGDFEKLLDGVREGNPTKHQTPPDEEDPVCGETADEAEASMEKNGLVNPFHAAELQRRQNKRRREEQEGKSLFGDLVDEVEDHE